MCRKALAIFITALTVNLVCVSSVAAQKKELSADNDQDADAHFRSQYTFLTNARGEVAVDFVGRYETLASDFQFVQQTVGIPAIELPRIQVARPAVSYADYYTAATRSLVAERFREDINLFGYEFQAS